MANRTWKLLVIGPKVDGVPAGALDVICESVSGEQKKGRSPGKDAAMVMIERYNTVGWWIAVGTSQHL